MSFSTAEKRINPRLEILEPLAVAARIKDLRDTLTPERLIWMTLLINDNLDSVEAGIKSGIVKRSDINDAANSLAHSLEGLELPPYNASEVAQQFALYLNEQLARSNKRG